MVDLERLHQAEFVPVPKVDNGQYALMPGRPLRKIVDRFDLDPGVGFSGFFPRLDKEIITYIYTHQPKAFRLMATHGIGKDEPITKTALKRKSWNNSYWELGGNNYLVSLEELEKVSNPLLEVRRLAIMDVGEILDYDPQIIDFPLARQAENRDGIIEIEFQSGMIKGSNYWRAFAEISGEQRGELVLTAVAAINASIATRRGRYPHGLPIWKVSHPQLPQPRYPLLPSRTD